MSPTRPPRHHDRQYGRLPFHENADEVAVGLERVRIRPYQIIVWVSLSAKSVLELPPHAPRFPAILDTGHNHNFSIRHQHLVNWASIDPAGAPVRGAVREGGRRAPLYRLNAWLHPNQAGSEIGLPTGRRSAWSCRRGWPSTRTRPDSRRCPSSGCAPWFAASSTWPLTESAGR